MKLRINGEEREVAGVQNISDLLSAFKLEKKILVVEWNRTIINKEEYADTRLSDGDQIEIVHFVGGG